MQVYLFFALIFSICIAVFAVQNATKVDIDFFFWHINQISLVLVIFGSALVGSTVAGLFGVFKQLTLKKQLKSYKQMVAEHEKIDCCQKDSNKSDASGDSHGDSESRQSQ
ncbi:MAG TPA: lipopolysaccharide assembly protein LapA domain-containing protein [Desulfobacteria bacterium]|nr:lipopolysaccharide assembly protein LapA domain-containing protein [Desulfobacteria bacterium]